MLGIEFLFRKVILEIKNEGIFFIFYDIAFLVGEV